jgi:tRNA-Thr(GGU) m(6)t(6)A37 methyltransferase TsaA
MTEMIPIGFIKSPWPERFGIPRQPGLAAGVKSYIVLNGSGDMHLSVRGLDEFSHIWVLFHFHDLKSESWKPIVRPPRLGGKTGKGVFATRSPFRPNPIGLSAVKLLKIDLSGEHPVLEIEGGDFLNATPVLDIKPYVPYADSFPEAKSAWASDEDPLLSVTWKCDEPSSVEIKNIVESTIALDPRPAWERGKIGGLNQSWGIRIENYNVKWIVTEQGACIISIEVVK